MSFFGHKYVVLILGSVLGGLGAADLKASRIAFCSVLFLVPLLGGCGEKEPVRQEQAATTAGQAGVALSLSTTNYQPQTVSSPPPPALKDLPKPPERPEMQLNPKIES